MSRRLPFTKLHGAGNDFVLLDGLRETLPKDLTPLARAIADRHFGVGFDQMLVVRASDVADFRMEIYNADGSQVEMCANGIRAFYKYLRDAGHTKADEIGVETLSGVVRPRWAGPGRVRVDMGLPILAPAKIPTTLGSGDGPVLDVPIELASGGAMAGGGAATVTAAGDGAPAAGTAGGPTAPEAGAGTALWPGGPSQLIASSVSMGNPHCVIEVEDVDAVPLAAIGPVLEHHSAFPNRVNVELIEIVSRDRIRQRTWERGTGETLACGSGACAVAVSAMLRGVVDRAVTIELRGGELQIEWADPHSSVWMTGPAVTVFTGEWLMQDDAADERPQRA